MDETAPQVMEAQFDELIRTMLRMQPRHREVSVRDPEGQVEATCGPDGRLAKVTVEPRWQDKIEPGDLSTVLLTTIAEAQLEASGLNDDDRPEPTEEEVAAKREEMMRMGEQALEAPSSDATLQAKVDNLPNLFDQLDMALDQLNDSLTNLEVPIAVEEAEQLNLKPAGGVEIRSENSMVTVTVYHGSVVDVAIHQSWLPGKSGHALTECFDQIIDQLNEPLNS